MRRLAKPTASVSSVFSQCLSVAKSDEEKAKLIAIAPLIAEAGARYESFATLKQLHLLTREQNVGGTVTIGEMKDLYASAMSSRSGAARQFYDEIVNAAPNRICPLCGVGTVSSLDHHLPQSKYPEYVVVPVNLIPACADCNKTKFTKFPRKAEQQTIHPYFDDYSQETWLYAEVIESGPPALRFRADAPATWTSVDRQRVQYHFSVFKLSRLFASNAGNELGNIRSHLVSRLKGKDEAIRLHLLEQAETCKSAHRNSWRTAMYEALSGNLWFITEGFRLIPYPQ